MIALGKAGSREMTAASDLDLMTVYEAPPDAVSSLKEWSADVWGARFTQRLIAALSANTGQGGLYEVDMRLRPSGSKGPVSVRLSAFAEYYAQEAATWEFMALTRARVAWASDADFGSRAEAAILEALRRPRPGADVAADVRKMRDLMDRERRPDGFWDVKLSPGGLVDAEFLGQFRQLRAGPEGGSLAVSTLFQLRDEPEAAEAWRLQQAVGQVLACAYDERPDPDAESAAFRQRLAQAVDASDFEALVARIRAARTACRAAFESALPPTSDGS